MSRISKKLTLYFALALGCFAFLLGGVFLVLFRNHTVSIQKKQLLEQAEAIAGAISSDSQMGNGYGAYMRIAAEVAGINIWIVDSDKNVLTSGSGHHGGHDVYGYHELPEHAGDMIGEVFEDRISYSKAFSGILDEPTLTVGVPIVDGRGSVSGAVLLHSSIRGMDEAQAQGFGILLFSVLVAMVISVILGWLLSCRFTRPLNRMKNTALQLMGGDYSVRTQVRKQDEIGELAAAIDDLAVRLQQGKLEEEKTERLRRDFIANISHELKTPVTVVRGSLEALRDKVVTDPEKVEEYQEQMLRETIFLQRLVNDLLDLTKLQNPDFAIEKNEISISSLLQDAVRSARQLAKEKEITVSLLAEEEMNLTGDYERLRQMLMVVLDNAVKFSNRGGLVEVHFQNRCLTVRNQGEGIREEDIPNLFTRFYRIRSEQNKTGTGLGLPIAKEIADRHGIRLEVKSSLGQGTEILFFF